MTYAESFDQIDDGQGQWQIRHHGTDLVAGRIIRTAQGFELLDSQGNDLGAFPTIRDALRTLYGSD